ncbi:MAG TPA: DUF202 domain-containing protein [Thermomicrobiaceae bacterium]|nr:DUF202 domain-containing protein [Thermomicrobiaceae bacterium]
MGVNDDEPIAQADPESRARTHLANERTFLAWLRTGTGLIALGLGAAQFLTHDVEPGFPLVRILAVTLVLTGIVVTVTGGRRYRGNVRRIERRTFQPAERSIVLSAAAVSLVGLLAIAFIIILRG